MKNELLILQKLLLAGISWVETTFELSKDFTEN